MRFAAPDEPAAASLQEATATLAETRGMTSAELRQLGTPCVVYMRAGLMNGEMAYAIYAADGTMMSVVDDVELAIELVAEHGMTFVAVH